VTVRDNQTFGPRWGTEADKAEPTLPKEHPKFNQEQKPAGDHRSLAKQLHRMGYHPIMLFGTRAAGKSSLLASMFYYLQSSPNSPAIWVRGEWIIPTESPYGKSVADAASRFLSHVVNSFHDGTAPPATHDEFPFYIPVILRPNNGKPEVKLAFLESRGEWYQIKHDSTNLYPELRDEVADVYKSFPKGITILLIAPYIIGDAYSNDISDEWAINEMRESDTALFGALQAYQIARQNRSLDKYLFLLTKWDAHTRSVFDEEFTNPPEGLVSHLISERFPKSWILFQSMQTGEALSMQYSAGMMSGGALVKAPPELKPKLDRFPEILWRWLYSNSTDGIELFDLRTKPRPSWLRRLFG
jgi:hypothetical protein